MTTSAAEDPIVMCELVDEVEDVLMGILVPSVLHLRLAIVCSSHNQKGSAVSLLKARAAESLSFY